MSHVGESRGRFTPEIVKMQIQILQPCALFRLLPRALEGTRPLEDPPIVLAKDHGLRRELPLREVEPSPRVQHGTGTFRQGQLLRSSLLQDVRREIEDPVWALV